MFTHKTIFNFFVFIIALVISGCAASYAPDDWLPDTGEIPQNSYGGWITVVSDEGNVESEEKWLQYSGEFIAVNKESIYLLYDSLYIIRKDKIVSSTIELDQKNTTLYGAWVAGGSAATLSHGGFAIFTLPMWMIGGISAVSGESLRDRYEEEYPDETYWSSVTKYCRFPQGVEGIDLSNLRPFSITKDNIFISR